jgi:hypothetical protein
VREQHGAAGGVQQEGLHQAAPVLPQLLHQLRQEERHLRAEPPGRILIDMSTAAVTTCTWCMSGSTAVMPSYMSVHDASSTGL